MAMTYNVTAYKNGKPWKFTSVLANNKEEAILKGWEKFRAMGVEPDKVTAS
ncbi:MAG: hypothetical protein KGV46_00730 [Pasteurella sp.]|nr:hypothetical protein [Pasteurella sp.]